MVRELPYRIDGIQTVLGATQTMDEWAERVQVPNRKTGGVLSGAEMTRILGIHGKSWDPVFFEDLSRVAQVATAALQSAAMGPDEVDAVIIVTCTPYQIMLDQDAFRLLREVGIPDHVVPLLLGAGCAGLARAMALAAQLSAKNLLIISYNVPSLVGEMEDGRLSPVYRENVVHPLGAMLWTSPAIFSDAAAALVLRRTTEGSRVLYSRDSKSFGDQPGFKDPLIHYLGGGGSAPPSNPNCAQLAAYGMAGDQVKRYYSEGMMLNHYAMEAVVPGYLENVRRIYTHQASPHLIADFVRRAALPPEKTPTNAARLGNLVTPCTLHLLQEDLLAGIVKEGDQLCFSVVGAGPERGILLIGVGAVAPVEWNH